MARLSTLLGGRGSVGSSDSVVGNPPSGVIGCETRPADEAGIEEASFEDAPFRRLRPPRRPRRRRFTSGDGADSEEDRTGVAAELDSSVETEDSKVAAVTSSGCAGPEAEPTGGVN